MDISIFSVIMAMVWFTIFAAIFSYLMRKDWFIQHFNVWLLVLLAALCVARAVVAIEFPNAVVILSQTLLPAFRDFLYIQISPNITVLNLIVAIWVIGSIVMLVKLFINYIAFRRWLLTLTHTTDVNLLSMSTELGKPSKEILIYHSSDIAYPMITGFFVPVILIPKNEFPSEYLQDILLHEYSHFKHGDLWAKRILNIACCFLWWHPLSYTLLSDLDHSLEIKCDTDIISKKTYEDRVQYYAMLYELLKNVASSRRVSPQPFTLGLISTRKEKQLLQRFRLGLDYKKRKHYFANTIFCIILIVAFVFSYAFIFQSFGVPEDEPGIFEIRPDNAYIVDNGDGTFDLYVDDMNIGQIGSPDIEPYSQLPIKER